MHDQAALTTLLLRSKPTPAPGDDSVDERWSELVGQCEALPPACRSTTAMAALGGLQADRLAWAFLAGYQHALRALVPDIAPHLLAALCVTERDGNSPSAIRTTLEQQGDGWVLNGEKTFVTGAPSADLLLIAATAGNDGNGRAIIKLLQLPTDRPGITLTPGRELGMVPELPHGSAHIKNVRIHDDEILPGDGYSDYVKRFRTIEDTHVQSAVCGYLLSVARRFAWPQSTIEPLLCIISVYTALGIADPDSPATHLQLAGVEQLMGQWLTDNERHWQDVETAEQARWQRDRKLMTVAGKTREIRRQRAWQRLAGA